MTRFLSPLLLAPVCLIASGCLSIEKPDEFLTLEHSSSEFKAISHDEAKFWVREFTDYHGADLDFWSRTLEQEFEENRGYTSLEEREVEDGTGRKGIERVYEITVQGVPYRYLCTLFLIEGWWNQEIRIAEFTAPTSDFDRYVPEIRKSIQTLRP